MALEMTIKCDKNSVLSKIKENRDIHKKVYDEAVVGFKEKAKEELKKRMKLLERGEITSDFNFFLQFPENHLDEYDTAITMLEYHQETIIELEPHEVRNLIEDKWDWSRSFWTNNSCYSATAISGSAKLGYR